MEAVDPPDWQVSVDGWSVAIVDRTVGGWVFTQQNLRALLLVYVDGRWRQHMSASTPVAGLLGDGTDVLTFAPVSIPMGQHLVALVEDSNTVIDGNEAIFLQQDGKTVSMRVTFLPRMALPTAVLTIR